MMTTFAMIMACYLMVVAFRVLSRARRTKSPIPWRRVGGLSAGSLLCFLAAIFVLPAVEAGWGERRADRMPMMDPMQVRPDYGNVEFKELDWDSRLDGQWVCSGPRLATLRFEPNRFEEVLKPEFEDGLPASGKAQLWQDGDGNLLLELTAEENAIDLFAATMADGEPSLLPPAKVVWYWVQFSSADVVSLRCLNYPFRADIDFFVNAGTALMRELPEPAADTEKRFQRLTDHLMSFAVDGRLPSADEASTSEVPNADVQQELLAITGYWLPTQSRIDGDNVETPAVYRFFFNEGIFYQWTGSPYDFQASYFELRPDADPKEFDFHFSVGGKPERLFGIYQVTDSELKMCWSRLERPTGFTSNKGQRRQLMEFQRLAD